MGWNNHNLYNNSNNQYSFFDQDHSNMDQTDHHWNQPNSPPSYPRQSITSPQYQASSFPTVSYWNSRQINNSVASNNPSNHYNSGYYYNSDSQTTHHRPYHSSFDREHSFMDKNDPPFKITSSSSPPSSTHNRNQGHVISHSTIHNQNSHHNSADFNLQQSYFKELGYYPAVGASSPVPGVPTYICRATYPDAAKYFAMRDLNDEQYVRRFFNDYADEQAEKHGTQQDQFMILAAAIQKLQLEQAEAAAERAVDREAALALVETNENNGTRTSRSNSDSGISSRSSSSNTNNGSQ